MNSDAVPLIDSEEMHLGGDAIEVYRGWAISVQRQSFEFLGEHLTRDVLVHPGSSAVVALRRMGDVVEILLIRQYRHPVRRYLWELPAGLRDVVDENAEECAGRELIEETGYRAKWLVPLTKSALTPGGSSEVISIFLTADTEAVSRNADSSEGEERDLQAFWWSLEVAEAAVLAGHVMNAAAQIGILAAVAAVRHKGFNRLREI